MRVANHSSIGRNPSILVGWIYVDAIDGTLLVGRRRESAIRGAGTLGAVGETDSNQVRAV